VRHCHYHKFFPYQTHWGRWHCTSFLRLACLFTVHVGSGPSPLSCGVFLPPLLLQAFMLLVAGCVSLLLPSLLGLFIYSSVRDFPSPLFSAQGAPPSLLCVFFVTIAYYSVFFPGWGSVCPGGYADLDQGCQWEYHVSLSSLCVLHLPKRSGHWHLAVAQKPSWFLHLMCSGDAMRRLEVWRSQSFASSRWFFL
jgi:hypothetical protein